jgi:hypothetical protein
MIVTRGLGRAAVVGVIVAFGLGADPLAAPAAGVFSGGNACIGTPRLVDQLERLGPALLDQDARLGGFVLDADPARIGAAAADLASARIGALLAEDGARVGETVLADDDERIGASELTGRARIGGSILKKRH